jgi:hypothetical protein
MPKKGSGDELIELYGLARQALGLVDGEASNIAANIGTAPSGVMIEGSQRGTIRATRSAGSASRKVCRSHEIDTSPPGCSKG